VVGLAGITAIAAGQCHAVALKDDRTVWAWGRNDRGQLGAGTNKSSLTPVPVKLANGTPLAGVTAVAAGTDFTVALAGDGGIWAWGGNRGGQFGQGLTTARFAPGPLKLPDGTPLTGIAAIAAGGLHATALKSDGSVWGWGNNEAGQLGDGTTVTRSFLVPVRLADGSPLSGISAIAAGWRHTVARKADGSVWVWGAKVFGQLGDGTTTNQSAPVPVKRANGTQLTGITAIGAGVNYTVVVVGGMGAKEATSDQ